MHLRLGCLARMATRALSIVEPVRQRGAPHITVILAVGIVAVGACHGPVEIADAVPVITLIRERSDPPVRKERLFSELGKSQRVLLLERLAGQVSGFEDVFERVTLEADLDRFVLGETGERMHSDVGFAAQLSVLRLLHVPSTGPVTRLTVDRVAHEAGVVAKSGRVETELDLTSVALLAVGEPLVRAERSNRRPIATIGDRNVGRDRNPPLIRSSSATAEPQVLLADEIER